MSQTLEFESADVCPEFDDMAIVDAASLEDLSSREPRVHFERAWYVLCHPDQRVAPRISAFIDFVVEELPTLRKVLGG
ncbi:MAG: hypothetical protein IPK28_22960 [Devosia sp.]|nr:hypothetical protein [Devosia sp.]